MTREVAKGESKPAKEVRKVHETRYAERTQDRRQDSVTKHQEGKGEFMSEKRHNNLNNGRNRQNENPDSRKILEVQDLRLAPPRTIYAGSDIMLDDFSHHSSTQNNFDPFTGPMFFGGQYPPPSFNPDCYRTF